MSQHVLLYIVLLQNHAMSHVQLLRAILHGLADPRSFSQGLFMQWGESQGSRAGTAPSQQAMRKAFEVVFVDGSGWCNLAAHVSKSALKQVRLTIVISAPHHSIAENPCRESHLLHLFFRTEAFSMSSITQCSVNFCFS